MPWPATRCYGLVPAPGALALVQDLLNTASAAREPDLLADLASARTWVSDAAAAWSAATGLPVFDVVLDADGLQELRAFRDDLRCAGAAQRRRRAPGRVADAVGGGFAQIIQLCAHHVWLRQA